MITRRSDRFARGVVLSLLLGFLAASCASAQSVLPSGQEAEASPDTTATPIGPGDLPVPAPTFDAFDMSFEIAGTTVDWQNELRGSIDVEVLVTNHAPSAQEVMLWLAHSCDGEIDPAPQPRPFDNRVLQPEFDPTSIEAGATVAINVDGVGVGLPPKTLSTDGSFRPSCSLLDGATAYLVALGPGIADRPLGPNGTLIESFFAKGETYASIELPLDWNHLAGESPPAEDAATFEAICSNINSEDLVGLGLAYPATDAMAIHPSNGCQAEGTPEGSVALAHFDVARVGSDAATAYQAFDMDPIAGADDVVGGSNVARVEVDGLVVFALTAEAQTPEVIASFAALIQEAIRNL